MPEAVRTVIDAARGGKGPAAVWLTAKGRGWGQVGTTLGLLRDKRLSPELAGWLAGIAMFGDDTDRLVDELEGHVAARFALLAFAIGVRANVPTAPGQWKRIERIAGLGTPPSELGEAVAIGLTSNDREIRDAAKRLFRLVGDVVEDALEAASEQARGADKRRLNTLRAKVDPNVALLMRLLEGWRATCAPELERAIENVGRVLARTREPIAGKTREAIEENWATVAKRKDPLDVTRLLDSPWPKHLDPARRRVEMFSRFPPDPRIVLGVAATVKRHCSADSLRLHKVVAGIIATHPTPSVLPMIDAIIAAHFEDVREVYDDARAAAARPARAADPALLAAAAALGDPTAELQALWATHVASPGDLDHRSVLGDALQRAGDPRGELIALQLAPERDASAKKRISELIAAHADTWTGPIPFVSKSSREFERGFLVAMRCLAFGSDLRAVIDRPEWVTLEDLYLDGANCALSSLLKRMPLLRRFATPHAVLLEQLARTGTYTSIEALASGGAWIPPPKPFPNLRVIGGRWLTSATQMRPFEIAQYDAAKLGVHAIVHLGVPLDAVSAILDFTRTSPAETRLAIGGDFAGFDTQGWRVRLTQGSSAVEVAWGGGPSALKQTKSELVDLLRARRVVREVKRIDLGAITAP